MHGAHTLPGELTGTPRNDPLLVKEFAFFTLVLKWYSAPHVSLWSLANLKETTGHSPWGLPKKSFKVYIYSLTL